MTILPTYKKKREREREGVRQGNTSGEILGRGDRNTMQQPPQMRRIKKSPRPGEMRGGPPIKRAAIYGSPSGLTSPLGSPRSSSHDDHHLQPGQPQNCAGTGGGMAPGATVQNPIAASPVGNNNSDDEYEAGSARDEQLEREFAERLGARGLIIKEMEGDGACMFRAIAEQIYGDQEMHGQIRNLCMDYMENNRDYYSDFITEDFEQYIERKRHNAVHGNHVELQAISEMFARPVEVYQYSDEPISILLPRIAAEGSADDVANAQAAVNAQQNPPLRLSYHGAVHYNAIVDPQAATIGVGLGLPGHVPGAAEASLLTDAMLASERSHLEETMLQDKMRMTDWQRTQADLEEQISRESYLEYVRSMEKPKKSPPREGSASSPQNSPKRAASPTQSTTITPTKLAEKLNEDLPSGSKTVVPVDLGDDEASCSSVGNAPKEPSTSRGGLYEEMLAAQSLDWETYDEDVAMAEALLLSRQEFAAHWEEKASSSRENQQ